MIYTKQYTNWKPDPDVPGELIVMATKEIAGGAMNYTFRVPVDPEKTWDTNKPIKIQYVYRKIMRVWQPN